MVKNVINSAFNDALERFNSNVVAAISTIKKLRVAEIGMLAILR